MTDSGHVLEPRDDVDQIENKPRTIAVPRAHRVLKRLERKSAAVKRLAGLWGSGVRFPVENPVRAPSSTRFRKNALHVARRRSSVMTSVNTSVFRMGHVEFVRVLAHGGRSCQRETNSDVDHFGTSDVLHCCLRRLTERVGVSMREFLQFI
jgi:hypothetical protein